MQPAALYVSIENRAALPPFLRSVVVWDQDSDGGSDSSVPAKAAAEAAVAAGLLPVLVVRHSSLDLTDGTAADLGPVHKLLDCSRIEVPLHPH